MAMRAATEVRGVRVVHVHFAKTFAAIRRNLFALSASIPTSSSAGFRKRTGLGSSSQMLAKRIIPCLDVHAGRVVKGVNFVNLQDAGDPVEIARKYEQQGADELVFLDITASHEQRDIILDVVARTSEVIFMPLTVLTGLYGMNVPLPHLPGGEQAQFWWVIVFIGATAGTMLFVFRRRNWW